MRRTILLAAAVVFALAVTAPAASAGSPPSIVQHQHFDYTEPGYYGISCPGFDVLWTASGDETYIRYFDKTGAVVRETDQFWFTGTLYNGNDLDKTVPYMGRGMIVQWPDGTVLNNTSYRALIDGKPVLLEAGLWFTGAEPTSNGEGIGQDAAVLCPVLS